MTVDLSKISGKTKQVDITILERLLVQVVDGYAAYAPSYFLGFELNPMIYGILKDYFLLYKEFFYSFPFTWF